VSHHLAHLPKVPIGLLINVGCRPPFSHVPWLSGRSAVEARRGLYPCCSSPDARATRDMRHALTASAIGRYTCRRSAGIMLATSQCTGISESLSDLLINYSCTCLSVSKRRYGNRPPRITREPQLATISISSRHRIGVGQGRDGPTHSPATQRNGTERNERCTLRLHNVTTYSA
jgi:hypothetical protein